MKYGRAQRRVGIILIDFNKWNNNNDHLFNIKA